MNGLMIKSKQSKQSNPYYCVDSCGREVPDTWIYASNINEARQIARDKYGVGKGSHYYWSVKRQYNGGARG
jgi:hypothetical protein